MISMHNIWHKIINRVKFSWGRAGAPAGAGMAQLAKWIEPLLIVCAVTAVSFLLVDIFYKVLSFQLIRQSASAKSSAPAFVSASERSYPAERYHVIAKRNLFQTTLEAIALQDADEPAGPRDEYTAFDLRGTIAVGQATGYAIVEEKGKGKQKLYRLGEMMGSAKLTRITRNEVVLRDSVNEYVMKIKETAKGGAGRFNRDISLSKGVVMQGLGDLKTIMSQAIVRPFFLEGVQQGFVVSNIVSGSLYQKLGLENGDVVMDVNGKKLEGADDIVQLVNVMQEGESLSLNLMRKGKQEAIHYTFH